MKKNFFFLPVILLTFILAITLFSCSKENIVSNPLSNELIPVSNSAGRISKWGSVTGLVLPGKAAVKIGIYNSDFFSEAFYYTRDGRFRFDGIPAGVYTVVVVDIATSARYEVTDVKVMPGKVTEIRTVAIQ